MTSHNDHQIPESGDVWDSLRLGFDNISVAICDRCSSPINANDVRYRCEQCPDYDACQECYFSAPTCLNRSTHTFISVPFQKVYLHQFYKWFTLDFSLNQIRILHVHGANNYDDPIEACLKVESLDTETLWYSALSYCWGTGLATRLMKINSVSIPITDNLESALKRIRSMTGQVRIWVDAICINQFENDEKTFQVGMMRRIYSRANSVYVYLGEQSAESLSKPPFSRHEEQRIIEELNSQKPLSKRAEHETVLRDIIDRPWFSRTWVIQESSVNSHVTCIYGSLKLDLDRLIERIDVLGSEPKATSYVGLVADHAHPAIFTLRLIHELRMNWGTRDMPNFLSRLDNIVRHANAPTEDTRRIPRHPTGTNPILHLKTLLEERESNISAQPYDLLDLKKLLEECASTISALPFKLINLLEGFRRLSATDPRDKIYAALGLATDASNRPRMNYELSPASVFETFAADLVRKGDGISVLHAAVSHSQGMDLPSWVPDWTSQKCTYAPLNSLLDPSNQAGGNMIPNLEPLDDESAIRLSGRIADRVWFISKELKTELVETATDQNLRCIRMLWQNQVFAYDHNGGQWWVREGIKENRLDQMRERDRAKWYPEWLSWLSIIISMKMFTHLRPEEVQQNIAKRQEERQATLPIAQNTKAQSHDNDGAPPTTSYIEPTARSFGDLEVLMVQAVDPATFLPVPNPEGGKDRNYYLLENRCLCITHNGRLGLVPKTAQEGDEILIFPGAVTPFVVRGSGNANEDEPEGRRLIGDCYIRGLMHGEGLQEDDMGQILIT